MPGFFWLRRRSKHELSSNSPRGVVYGKRDVKNMFTARGLLGELRVEFLSSSDQLSLADDILHGLKLFILSYSLSLCCELAEDTGLIQAV